METSVSEKLEEILKHYNDDKSNLIPILQEAQGAFGYLSEEVMGRIARFLRISESNVYGVGTFYSQFKFVPTGKKLIKVCKGTACHVRSGERILQEVQRHLGIKPGETTKDMKYSLESIACFGSCALAPVMVVNEEVYGRMTTARVAQILND